MYPYILLLGDVRYSSRYCHSDKIPGDLVSVPEIYDSKWLGSPQFHIDALIAFELLLHVLEQKVERLCLSHLARRRQLL